MVAIGLDRGSGSGDERDVGGGLGRHVGNLLLADNDVQSGDGRRRVDIDGAPDDFDRHRPYYVKERDTGGRYRSRLNRDRQVACGGGAGSYTGLHDDEEAVDLDDDSDDGAPCDFDRHGGDSGDGRRRDDDDGARGDFHRLDDG